MARYGKKAQSSVKRAMHKRKHGTLRSGSGGKVRSRKQAIAIGLSEARKKGAKVPRKRSRSGSRSQRTHSAYKTSPVSSDRSKQPEPMSFPGKEQSGEKIYTSYEDENAME